MRFFPFTLCFVLAVGAHAQQQVRIVDPAVLDNPQPVRKSRGAEAAMRLVGLPIEQQTLVVQYGEREFWPEGLRNDSLRKSNAAYIQNYACFRVASYVEDSITKSLVMVPAKENIHMPEALRPLNDFYLVLPEPAVSEVNTGKPRPEISRGPQWKHLATATIILPEELYATYDLSQDSVALTTLANKGMSQAEIDAVVFRSTDRNWPDGIDSFDERQKLLPKFTKYKAYVGAKWADKVLLIIPVEKNKKQPTLMRPYVDLYFVYNQSAVRIKEKKKKR